MVGIVAFIGWCCQPVAEVAAVASPAPDSLGWPLSLWLEEWRSLIGLCWWFVAEDGLVLSAHGGGGRGRQSRSRFTGMAAGLVA